MAATQNYALLRYRRLYLLLLAILMGASLWKGISLGTKSSDHSLSSTTNDPMRILYIVTSLAEYNTGHRATARGSDRLQETLIPVLVEGVESMLSFGYQVDVYLVCHWKIREDRLKLVQQKLPPSVGLEYWDESTPIGYEVDTKTNQTVELIVHLARQHRFVIRDKLLEYDMFLAFEDDMLIKGEHVQHYHKMSTELARLRTTAPNEPPKVKKERDRFHGVLSKGQLQRLIPGLMRVEVLLDEETYGTQTKLAPIPVDLGFDKVNRTVDPRPCCHVSAKTTNDHIPAAPSSDKLFVWESGIQGMSVREIPSLGWVMFMGGTNNGKAKQQLGDYWSGKDKVFGEGRPGPMDGRFIGNQGGWMATRQQIWEWHTEVCPGGFLPAFDPSDFRLDGLDARNVEFWSGGINLFSFRHACNLQRIVSLDPDDFSRHLIEHSANNKQKQLAGKRERFVKVNNLLGQLNTVRKRAEMAKQEELSSNK